MSFQEIGRGFATACVAVLLGVSIGAGAAAADDSKQNAATAAGRHHVRVTHRLYNYAGTSVATPPSDFGASYSASAPPRDPSDPLSDYGWGMPLQNPLDAWGGYFANPIDNPNDSSSNGG